MCGAPNGLDLEEGATPGTLSAAEGMEGVYRKEELVSSGGQACPLSNPNQHALCLRKRKT